MTLITQTELVARHLKEHKRITPLDALKLYRIMRLGARIWELRRQGMTIKSKLVSWNGKHFAEYSI
jgi:hypothetical protein